MEKLDRLGWAAGLAFESYGVRIGVRVNDATILPRLASHFPPGWRALTKPRVERLYSLVVASEGATRRGVKGLNLVYGDINRLARTRQSEDAFDAFESDLQLYVAEAARRRVFVHAGVVGWRGRAVIIAGRSFTGKTTLVAELVRAGATYYSDEYAVLDARGRVHPFPRPLGVRTTDASDTVTGTTRRQQRVAVESLGGRAGARPLVPALVVLSEYRAGARRWRPRTLTAGHGLLALVANTVTIRSRPAEAFAALQAVATRARILSGVRGEAKDLAATILRMVEDHQD
ncbi:MAG TPA: hypothetical protein VF666_08865 [Pyrinomonadaceae bacterium]|jgi:hypothetical protein